MADVRVSEFKKLSDAYRELADSVAGPPGGTCTQAEAMSDVEWTRRHWRNAIDQWSFWRNEAEILGGPQPVSLVIRAKNWEARARDAEARLAQAEALLDAWCTAAEDGEPLGPLREQTLGWLG